MYIRYLCTYKQDVHYAQGIYMSAHTQTHLHSIWVHHAFNILILSSLQSRNSSLLFLSDWSNSCAGCVREGVLRLTAEVVACYTCTHTCTHVRTYVCEQDTHCEHCKGTTNLIEV